VKTGRRKKVFERIVNPLLLKHLTSKVTDKEESIAKGIPIKYLKYFKEVSNHKNAKKIRYRYRGKSKLGYDRPYAYCHMNGADTFAIYYR
jgi:hypothetical protein|tara:strand:- start:1918 stop:2187 length:270 start_codon:yes stop_codon:yes gene_type:complete